MSRVKALIDHSTDPATPLFDQPDVQAAVQWYTDLYLKDKVTPYFEPVKGEVSALNLPESYKLVQAGKAAMSTDSGLSWQVRKQQTKTMSLAPMPIDKANDHTSPMFASGVVMSSGTTKPDAAWRWMNFLSQQAPTSIATFKRLPARLSVLQSSGLLDKLDPDYAAAVRFAFDHVMASEQTPVGSAFTDAIESILKDGKPIEQALADAQTKAKENIAEAAQESGRRHARPDRGGGGPARKRRSIRTRRRSSSRWARPRSTRPPIVIWRSASPRRIPTSWWRSSSPISPKPRSIFPTWRKTWIASCGRPACKTPRIWKRS